MSDDRELGRFGQALAALSAAPPSPEIFLSHDFWSRSEHYRRARWRRVQAVIAKGETPKLLIRHYEDCCSGPIGDQQFREELAAVLAGPEPTINGYDDDLAPGD